MTEQVSRPFDQAFRMHAGRLLFFSAVALAPHAHADLYKWTDARGNVHYGDQAPAGQARIIHTPAAGQSAITSQARQSLDAQEQAFQKRRQAAADARAKADKEAEQTRMRRENCAKARSNLSALQNSPRVYSTDAAGQRSYMDDAARERATADSQKAVADFCK